jgi:amino acid adenylation domain-containing protein
MDILDQILARPDLDVAVVIGGKSITFGELHSRARRLASVILESDLGTRGVVGVFTRRSFIGFQAILAALIAGVGFVPLNLDHPRHRTRAMCQTAGIRTVVVDDAGMDVAASGSFAADSRTTVLCPQRDRVLPPMPDPAGVVFRDVDWRHVVPAEVRRVSDQEPAYIMFTSGTTGSPNAVPVRRSSVDWYAEKLRRRHPIHPADKVSQTFELTFDLSVHDILVNLSAGASVHVVERAAQLAPASEVARHDLSVWFSVPSVVAIAQRLGQLMPGSMPSLRRSTFCGEQLKVADVEAWQAAAPNSEIVNLYGPTEATIAISSYKADLETLRAESRRGVVPIGTVFGGHEARVVPAGPDDSEDASTEDRGELWLRGPQVALGYLNADTPAADRFVRSADPADDGWYRTGDLVEVEPDGTMHHIGRIDQQVKLRGHRIELAEVEAAWSDLHGARAAAVVAFPADPVRAQLVLFVIRSDAGFSEPNARRQLLEHLPSFMLPSHVIPIAEFPLNGNGKIDRTQLCLDAEARRQPPTTTADL